jgi:FKBP-type peptidyl-prolyl cis-trans isomerase FklB
MKLTHAFLAFGLSATCALAQTRPPTLPAGAQKSPFLQGHQDSLAPTNSEPLDPKKTGYALGLMQGDSIKKNDLGVDYQSLIDGMTDGMMSNRTPKMTEQEARDWYTKWQTQRRNQMMERRKQDEEKRKAEGAKNKAEGEEFLAKNAKESGVQTLPSGLQYKVVKEGTGATPKPGDTVSALYTGKLISGKEFDSTANRNNQPFKFVLGQGQVIKGWDEAVEHMKVGSKWTLFIPPNLAYGDNAPPTIGPGQVLIFDLELVDVTPAAKPSADANGGNQVVSGEIIKVPSADELKKGAKIEVIHPDNKTDKK